ncbi:MAG: tetratricopeptide repeat protein [Capsulimonadaceae bacterium]
MKRPVFRVALGVATILAVATVGCGPQSAIMTPNAQVRLGQVSMERHEWSDAVSHFRLAVSMGSNNWDANCDLGYAYLHRGEIDHAHSEFAEILRVHPRSDAAQTGLLLTCKNEGNRNAYLQQLKDDAATHPQNAEAIAAVAEALFDGGRVADAVQEANLALQVSPNLGHAHCILGHIALSGSDYDTARTELQKAVKADKIDDDAWAALGDIAMDLGDTSSAVDDYKRAVAAFPEHVAWHRKLADAYKKTGDPGSAQRENAVVASLPKPLPEGPASN